MEINIPNQVWIYNEINRLLTPHCRHAWYLAVKIFFLSGLLNLREANTNNCISVRYIFLTNSVPRCWKWNAVVDNSQTTHVRFTEKASRKFSSGVGLLHRHVDRLISTCCCFLVFLVGMVFFPEERH